MPATLTVDLETAKLDARLELAGIPATAPTYTIERASVESGNTAGVRGAVNAPTGGDTSIVVRDYEAPFNLDLVYTASLYDVDGAVVETVSVPFRIDWEECESWLVDLARPTNSLPLVIQSMTELTYDMPAGVHRVLGRRAPGPLHPAGMDTIDRAHRPDRHAQRARPGPQPARHRLPAAPANVAGPRHRQPLPRRHRVR